MAAGSKTSFRLIALIASAFCMEFLDGTMIAAALPGMARSFHESAARMDPGIIASLLTKAVCIPVSGTEAEEMPVASSLDTSITREKIVPVARSTTGGPTQLLTAVFHA